MKKILMALTLIGISYFSAEAQSEKKSSSAQNYPVCRYGDNYAVCGDVPKGYISAPSATPNYRNTEGDVYIEVSDQGTQQVPAEQFRKRHNIVVYDELQANRPPYTPPVKENEYRNMNVNQTSIILPPSTGGLYGIQ